MYLSVCVRVYVCVFVYVSEIVCMSMYMNV